MARDFLPARMLDRMIRDVASRNAECAHCIVGPVVEAPPDASGCNWRLSKIQGWHCAECLLSLGDVLRDLRANFLVGGEMEADPPVRDAQEAR